MFQGVAADTLDIVYGFTDTSGGIVMFSGLNTHVVNIFSADENLGAELAAGLFFHVRIMGFSALLSLDMPITKKSFSSLCIKDKIARFKSASNPAEGEPVKYIITNTPLPLALLDGRAHGKLRGLVRESFGEFRNINVLVKNPFNPEENRDIKIKEITGLMKEYPVPFIKYEPVESGLGKVVGLFDIVLRRQEEFYKATPEKNPWLDALLHRKENQMEVEMDNFFQYA